MFFSQLKFVAQSTMNVCQEKKLKNDGNKITLQDEKVGYNILNNLLTHQTKKPANECTFHSKRVILFNPQEQKKQPKHFRLVTGANL